MGLLKKLFTNCACPQGRMGGAMLKFMNLCHAPLTNCLQEVRRVLKSGGKFAILVEVVDSDSKWTNVVEGMTAYSPEDLKKLLDEAGFTQTEIHRKKPTYATIIGVKA